MATAFSQFGIEIETMIVGRDGLNPRPIADKVLKDGSDSVVNSIQHGPITWSNELVMHVLEFKTSAPVKTMDGLASHFHQSMLKAQKLLEREGACLLGSAMHPWFNPANGVKLWSHDDREIYDTFDRIFDSRGHGWSNLQSFHLNLPFDVGDDDSFRRLHSAIRLVLPLVPALAASSPFIEGRVSGILDTRMEMYRNNCIRIPSISGGVIPDVIHSQSEYQTQVFDVIAQDLKAHDPSGILEPEWTNARGAIARFDRGSIEIRVGDVQECPGQDLAIIQMLVHLVKQWYDEVNVSLEDQEAVSTEVLRQLFTSTMTRGPAGILEAPSLLLAYGMRSAMSVGQWLEVQLPLDSSWREGVWTILRHGNLAERLLRAVGQSPNSLQLTGVYQRLHEALIDNAAFVG